MALEWFQNPNHGYLPDVRNVSGFWPLVSGSRRGLPYGLKEVIFHLM
jgi:hypothetical protein